MTYAQGGLIQASDYNGFANNINSVWNTLYGQTAISTVAVGDRLQAQQWNSIYTSTANAAAHQGDTITPIPAATVGGKITYYPQLPTNISAITTNPYNCSASGTDVVGSSTRTTSWGGGVGVPTVLSTITWTFDSYDKLRYFFNCGGRLRINASSSVGSSTPADLSWNAFCLGMGVLALPAISTTQTITGSVYTGLTQFNNTITPTTYVRQGFYDLTSSPQQWFEQISGGGVYGADSISINYSVSGSTVIATILFEDTNNATIDGDLTVYAVARPGESNYISNSWGTPVISVAVPVTL
jgi:hypothetical protein